MTIDFERKTLHLILALAFRQSQLLMLILSIFTYLCEKRAESSKQVVAVTQPPPLTPARACPLPFAGGLARVSQEPPGAAPSPGTPGHRGSVQPGIRLSSVH